MVWHACFSVFDELICPYQIGSTALDVCTGSVYCSYGRPVDGAMKSPLGKACSFAFAPLFYYACTLFTDLFV